MKKDNGLKRILMLVENNSFPEDTRIFNEATTLTEAGHLVSVICPSKSNGPWHEVLEGIQVFRYPNPVLGRGFVTYIVEFGYSLAATFLLSLVALWKQGFDIIHAANPPDTAVFIAAVYKIFGKKYIFDQHDLSPEVYLQRFGDHKNARSPVYKVLLSLEKISCGLADHVIATNTSYKMLEMERDGVPEERITVVRNGPAPDAAVHPIQDIHRKGKKTLLYLGIIGVQDGVDCLIRSLYNLKYGLKRDDFLCVIAGDGNALPGVKSQASALGLSDSIMFPGWIEPANVASYIHSADICLAPEPSNDLNDRSTMVKIMEYMAFGKPIVAFDLPEHHVTAQGAALYAAPNNEVDFAQRIAVLMDDPDKCREMGQTGRERIEKELSWIHQKAHLLEAYNSMSERC